MKKKVSVMLVLVFGLLVGLTGCGKPEQSAKGEKIVLGVPSGLGQTETADNLKAVNLAVDEINERGGVEVGGKKYKLEVASIDTREAEPGVPVSECLSAVDKLISEKKPAAIVLGAMRSEILLASMDLVAEYKIPYIGAQAISTEMENKIAANYNKYKYFFRTTTNGTALPKYLSAGVEFIGKEFKFDKIYFMFQDVPWAKGLAGAVAKSAQGGGWTVVGEDAYPTGASDFSSSLSKAKASGAQVIVTIFDMPQAGTLVKQAKAMKVPALIAGYMAPITTGDAWDTYNGEIGGLIGFLFNPGPIAIKSSEISVKFTQNYAKKYGEAAMKKVTGSGLGASYDAVYVLVEAIKRANSLNADAIVSALEKTDYNGVVGRIRFDKNHQAIYGEDPAETAIGLLFQWREGKRLVVFPKAVAETKIQLPEK